MSDPERLLDHGSDLEARLLSSAVDEPPPPDLLGRTLGAVLAAPPVPGPAEAAAAAKAGAASAAGGGILGAIGIGALAGLLTVGGFEALSGRGEPRPASSSTAPTASARPPEPPAAPPEPPSAETTSASALPAVPAASGARPSALAAEIALLDDARRALDAGDAARARDLLDRYAREIPRGQLAREAALLRAEVLAAIDAGKTNP